MKIDEIFTVNFCGPLRKMNFKALMSFHKFDQSCPLLSGIHTLSNFLIISFDLDRMWLACHKKSNLIREEKNKFLKYYVIFIFCQAAVSGLFGSLSFVLQKK